MIATPTYFSGFEPYNTPIDNNGKMWLYAHYHDYDSVKPYDWPKYVTFDGKLFKWSSWNSDNMYVCYRESKAPVNAIAC